MSTRPKITVRQRKADDKPPETVGVADSDTTTGAHLFPEDMTRMPVSSEPVRPEVRQLSGPEFIQRTRRVHLLTQRSKRRPGQYARGLDSRPEDFA